MNLRIRQFEENLNDLINQFSDLPWEARLLALELSTTQVQKEADKSILAELKESEEENAESIQPN